MMSKKLHLFSQIQKLIKSSDHTSIDHILKWVYKKYELFDMKDDDGLTLVHFACFEGQRECLEVFLKNGASVHIRSSVGWTPLHAATLGGKPDVVDYLLRECSADPLAKDEMGCLASDLTMDKDILNILTKFVDEIKARRELERLASVAHRQKSKRNTYCFDTIEHDTSPHDTPNLTRAQSMFVDANEAKQIREQLLCNKTKKETIGRLSNGFSSGIAQSFSAWTLSRQNSMPHVKSRSKVHQVNDPSSSSTSSGSFASIASSHSLISSSKPRVTSRSNGTEASAIHSMRGRTRESRNRDSGVFDDFTNEDSSSDRSVKVHTPDIPEEYVGRLV